MNPFEKTIYLIRHGETIFNKLKMVQGSGVDAELNETGQKQAWAFYETYKDIPFDKIYTSKLQRTHQTVAHFLHQKKIKVQQLTGLNEISWGNKEGRVINSDDDNQYRQMLQHWAEGDLTSKVINGESPLDVAKRQQMAWKYIMSQFAESCILVCMHGRAMRILLCQLLGIGIEQMDRFEHSNTCLYILKFEQGKFTITLENDISHLAKLSETNSSKGTIR